MDRLNALSFLVENFHFIDKKRICVVGQGYGAYIAAMMLAEDVNNLINCSVSISPITRWSLHSKFYSTTLLMLINNFLTKMIIFRFVFYRKIYVSNRLRLSKHRKI